jgi:plasmid stability protein
MVQIRNVPPELHRKLKARAALAGQSLSDYLLRELRDIAELPRLDEALARLAAKPRRELPRGLAAKVLREGRESRWR